MLETRIDLKKTALLVVDMQNDLIKASNEPGLALTSIATSKKIIHNTAKLLVAARQVSIPVIYTNHVHRADNTDVVTTITDSMLQGTSADWSRSLIEGTTGAAVVDELKPLPGDHVINKRKGSAFYGTDLELMLRARGVDSVIIAGVVTNGCIAATIQGARERDLNVIVISDCCATDILDDDNYYITKVFPRVARVRVTDEVITVLR